MVSMLLWARAAFGALFVFVTFQTLIAEPDPIGSGLALARWISQAVLRGAVSADKVAHFVAYCALGATAFWAKVKPFGKTWPMPLGLALYGGLLEIIQGLGGVRDAEFADTVADMLGAYAGFGSAVFLLRFIRLRAA